MKANAQSTMTVGMVAVNAILILTFLGKAVMVKGDVIVQSGTVSVGADFATAPLNMPPASPSSINTFFATANLASQPSGSFPTQGPAEGWAGASWNINATSIVVGGSSTQGFNGALGAGGYIYGFGHAAFQASIQLTQSYAYSSNTAMSGASGLSSASGYLPAGIYPLSGSTYGNSGGFSINLKLTPDTHSSQALALLSLAQLCSNTDQGNAGYANLSYLSSATDPSNLGFLANSYISSDGSQIDVAIRGTDLTDPVATVKNVAADLSFAGTTPSPFLTSEVADTAKFIKTLQAQHPNATIQLTGTSLGGAVAQLVGEASGLDTYAFNAPGGGQLYSQLGQALQVGTWGNSAGVNTNYRIYGDQISQVGTPIGSNVTIQQPANITYSPNANPVLNAMQNFSSYDAAHQIGTMITQITNDAPTVSTSGEPNVAQPLQNFIQPSSTSMGFGQTIYQFAFDASNAVASLLDPSGNGSEFVLTESPGSPTFASIDFPTLPGVAGYEVRYQIGNAWSEYSLIQPGALNTLPEGTSAIEFYAADQSGDPMALQDFLFATGFADSGAFSGTLTESSVPEPAALAIMVMASLFLLRRRHPIKRLAALSVALVAPCAMMMSIVVATDVRASLLPGIDSLSTSPTVSTTDLNNAITALTYNQPAPDLIVKSTGESNLVIDPSFEDSSNAWKYSGSAGPDGLDGGHTGTHSAFINVLPPDSGAVSQNIPTLSGQSYLVDFWLSSNIVANGVVNASFGGNTGFSRNFSANLPWMEYNFSETATSTESVLDFSSMPKGGTFFIDDVSVTAVPEPAIPGLLGICALVLLHRTRPKFAGI